MDKLILKSAWLTLDAVFSEGTIFKEDQEPHFAKAAEALSYAPINARASLLAKGFLSYANLSKGVTEKDIHRIAQWARDYAKTPLSIEALQNRYLSSDVSKKIQKRLVKRLNQQYKALKKENIAKLQKISHQLIEVEKEKNQLKNTIHSLYKKGKSYDIEMKKLGEKRAERNQLKREYQELSMAAEVEKSSLQILNKKERLTFQDHSFKHYRNLQSMIRSLKLAIQNECQATFLASLHEMSNYLFMHREGECLSDIFYDQYQAVTKIEDFKDAKKSIETFGVWDQPRKELLLQKDKLLQAAKNTLEYCKDYKKDHEPLSETHPMSSYASTSGTSPLPLLEEIREQPNVPSTEENKSPGIIRKVSNIAFAVLQRGKNLATNLLRGGLRLLTSF